MKTVIIVQARMSSTRLPGKILKSVLGKSLLEYQIERMKRIRGVDEIIIATTVNQADDVIVEFCKTLNVMCFRGSENDVLERYYRCAKAHDAHTVIRITSDCPLIDPGIVSEMLQTFQSPENTYDYFSNTLERTFPRGLDAEVFSFHALEKAYNSATLPTHLEHVTPYIYGHPELFKLGSFRNEIDESHHRWTVDTPEDFALIELLLKEVLPKKPAFSMQDLLAVLKAHPDWNELNAEVKQKETVTKCIVIRVDASVKIGTGHVMRCMTLAHTLRNHGYYTVFVVRKLRGHLIDYIEKDGFKVLALPEPAMPLHTESWAEVSSEQDAQETIERLRTLPSPPDLLIIDHYAFDSAWHQKLRAFAKNILVLDDLANRDLDCDLIVDGNFPAKESRRYLAHTPAQCETLCGPQYSFLREEFIKIRKTLQRAYVEMPRRLLIFYGGVDATNETAKTLRALVSLARHDLAIDVVIGASNSHQQEIAALIKKLPHAKLHIQTRDMPMLMAAADLSFGAGGTATWERLCLGLPTITICVAENQMESLLALGEQGYIEHLGSSGEVSAEKILEKLRQLFSSENTPKRLKEMSARGLALVDGQGTTRVLQSIQKLLMKQR